MWKHKLLTNSTLIKKFSSLFRIVINDERQWYRRVKPNEDERWFIDKQKISAVNRMAHCIHIQSRLIHLSCVRFFFVVFLGRLNVLQRFVALFSHSTNTSCNLAFNVFISVFMSSVTLLSNCCADVFFVCSMKSSGEWREKCMQRQKKEMDKGQTTTLYITRTYNVGVTNFYTL